MTDRSEERVGQLPLSARALGVAAAATDERYAARCPRCGSDLMMMSFLNRYECHWNHITTHRHELRGIKWWHGRLPDGLGTGVMLILYAILRWRHGEKWTDEVTNGA